jgi:hypothetical protein
MLEESFYDFLIGLVSNSSEYNSFSFFVLFSEVYLELQQSADHGNVIQSHCHFKRELSVFGWLL